MWSRPPDLRTAALWRSLPFTATTFHTPEKGQQSHQGRRTGPSGARNTRSGAYKATARGAHLSEIIRCLCLPGALTGRAALTAEKAKLTASSYLRLSDTQTRIGTAAAHTHIC